jgi:hypothetical protein
MLEQGANLCREYHAAHRRFKGLRRSSPMKVSLPLWSVGHPLSRGLCRCAAAYAGPQVVRALFADAALPPAGRPRPRPRAWRGGSGSSAPAWAASAGGGLLASRDRGRCVQHCSSFSRSMNVHSAGGDFGKQSHRKVAKETVLRGHPACVQGMTCITTSACLCS